MSGRVLGPRSTRASAIYKKGRPCSLRRSGICQELVRIFMLRTSRELDAQKRAIRRISFEER